ncbi:MAG: class I SAM-dependent methyltransferase, partial [Actinomycetota bacterium]
AVELGAALAAVARRNLARFPAVEVVTAPFEDWPLPEEPFDLVLAATAFHWIDPGVRVVKAADALRPATFRRYEWEQAYTTAGYVEVLLTYSGHRALDPAAQSGLLDCIAHLIDTGYGGRIVKRYLTELRVASTIGP